MLDGVTKKRIDTLRQILVGKLPDPKAQVEQITNGLIYKFMNDMDEESVSMGGKSTYFSGKYQKYSWKNLLDTKTSGIEKLSLYSEAIEQMNNNENLPELFREIFKNSFLPFKDPSTLNMFLKEINEFHYSNSEKLGDAFEYLLSFMGSQGDAGQFRTPRHIIDFIVEILNPQKNETILDPACGTAGFLISSYKHILKQNTKKNLGDGLTASDRKKIGENLNGYDISPDMVKMSLVNMYLHKFTNPKISEYDTLSSEDRWNEYYDLILANPPFFSPTGGITPHNRFGVKSTRAEVLFVDYINEHLKPNGRAGIIVPEGIIFQNGNAYKQLRKRLIETSLIGVISLPAGVFQPYSGVKFSILVLDKKISKIRDKIFFLEIKNDGYKISAKRTQTNINDLPKAIEDIENFKENKTFSIIDKAKLLSNKEFVFNINSYKNKELANSKFEIQKLSNLIITMHQGLNTAGEKVKFETNGIPILQTRNITSGKIDYKNMKYVNKDTYKKYSEKFGIQKNDILLANIGTIGKSLIVGSEDAAADVLIHWNIFKIKLNPEKINHKYFNYYLNYLDGINYFLQFQKGGTVNFISKKFLNELEIPLPSIEKQNQIVEELDGYQKIIDGCRQVIGNYKPSIDIDPKWKVKTLKDLIKLSSGNGLIQNKFKKGNYDVFGGNGIVGKHNEYFLEKPTIVIGRVGAYCGSIHITSPKSWVTDNGLYIKEFLEDIDLNFLYLTLISLRLNQYAKVGGQPSLSQQDILKLNIQLPPMEKQREIAEELNNLQKLINDNNEILSIYKNKVEKKINSIWSN